MKQIFQDAKDKYVVATIVYAKAGDTKAYVDPECKIQFEAVDLDEAFVKGAQIVTAAGTYVPVSKTVASSTGVVTLTYVTTDTTTATTAKLATVVSNASPTA